MLGRLFDSPIPIRLVLTDTSWCIYQVDAWGTLHIWCRKKKKSLFPHRLVVSTHKLEFKHVFQSIVCFLWWLFLLMALFLHWAAPTNSLVFCGLLIVSVVICTNKCTKQMQLGCRLAAGPKLVWTSKHYKHLAKLPAASNGTYRCKLLSIGRLVYK